MMHPQYAILCIFALSAAWGSAAAESAVTKISGSIEIAAGEHAGELSTVNGSIEVGANAVVQQAHAVNGSIRLDSQASAGELKTVNGAIELGEGVRVSGSVHSVNGRLSVARGADVAGDLHNVNGRIRVDSAHVAGSIDTVSGGIELSAAHVDGGIRVEKNRGSESDSTPPRVVIGAGSVVSGTLEFERPVKLYVSDQATIGPVKGATAIRFPGATPPQD